MWGEFSLAYSADPSFRWDARLEPKIRLELRPIFLENSWPKIRMALEPNILLSSRPNIPETIWPNSHRNFSRFLYSYLVGIPEDLSLFIPWKISAEYAYDPWADFPFGYQAKLPSDNQPNIPLYLQPNIPHTPLPRSHSILGRISSNSSPALT